MTLFIIVKKWKQSKCQPTDDYINICSAMLSHFSRVRLCVTPRDGSTPGSPVPGVLQARTLEWVAISFSNVCMHAKSLQLCPTLCDPMDSSPPGSSVHGILRARILEWVAISFSKLAQNHGQNPVSWIPSRTLGLAIPPCIYSLSVLSTGNTSFDPEKASPHGACILVE